MEKWRGWRKIGYESDLDRAFVYEIASIPGGDELFSCIQCGTCSGTCPLSPYMDYTPRRIIAMIRAGFRGAVLSSHTIWICASCYSCTVECPKEIKVTDIMYAAKRLAIRRGVHPRRFPTPILAGEFFNSVEKRGRNSESWVLTNLLLKTSPLKLFAQAGLGLRLWTKGRLSVRRESIKGTRELHDILKALEKEHMIETTDESKRFEEVNL